MRLCSRNMNRQRNDETLNRSRESEQQERKRRRRKLETLRPRDFERQREMFKKPQSAEPRN